MSGFYYAIYPFGRMGRDPEPPVFSVADQAVVNLEAANRLKMDEMTTRRQYIRLGAWHPQDPKPNPIENGSGDIISMTA